MSTLCKWEWGVSLKKVDREGRKAGFFLFLKISFHKLPENKLEKLVNNLFSLLPSS